MSQTQKLFATSLTLLFVVAGCGSQNSNLANLTAGKTAQMSPKNGEDNSGLGLSNGETSAIFAFNDPWFVSQKDGSPVSGQTDLAYRIKNSYRPTGMDLFMSSFVSIQDAETGQKCSGSRVREKIEIPGSSIEGLFILTAAHCFSKHDKIGRKILGLNRNINFSVWDYEPRVVVNDGSSISYYRVYRRIESSKKDYSNKPVFQFGSGDVVMIQIEEPKNLSSSNPLSKKFVEICPKSDRPEVTRSSRSGRLMLGSKVWPDWSSANEPFEMLLYRPMRQGSEKLGGVGNNFFNGDGVYNKRTDILNFLSQSASTFGANIRYDDSVVRFALANGEIPTPVPDDSAKIYSFTDLAANAGVGAGDSGLPVVEGDQSTKQLPSGGGMTLNVPLFGSLRCISGVLVREYWDNPNGSAGVGGYRMVGGIGTGVTSTSIIQPVSREDANLWKQVYPAESFVVSVQQTNGKREVFSREIYSTPGEASQKARQICISMLSRFVNSESESSDQRIECSLNKRDVRYGNQLQRWSVVDSFDLPMFFGKKQD